MLKMIIDNYKHMVQFVYETSDDMAKLNIGGGISTDASVMDSYFAVNDVVFGNMEVTHWRHWTNCVKAS